ncbi:hypothetical protein Vretimale_2114 [Volvox reticuliferus]|uniref:Uncharacterized protein n=1 Tax=Volvox reticuliferus TaxID=1737510 RepID=A0A8J4C462_9CHLO|nr:hypothetical protein Vretifemale_4325 [Volvox reticuliferus]GIL96257.1 hypothetical protein Vretimale_2114 [Volvox reticuliferus]
MFTAEDKFYIEVTGDALDVMKYINHVADPAAGAISTFSGVTRNNFQGKSVIKLEYEAYTPMALKKLEAVHWAIDELKASVPIWKKEFFEDGSTWKENPESRRLLQAHPGPGEAAPAVPCKR